MAHTALITGASTGIGRELARSFARDRHNLVLIARDSGRLETLAAELQTQFGIEAHVLAKDLCDPAAPRQVFDELQHRRVEVRWLVNNAGFGMIGPFDAYDLRQDLDMVRLNVEAVVHLTKLFLPRIRTTGGGVLNVASTAAFQSGPYMATYYATKAFVLSFSGALAEEMSPHGVTVTALCPGPTATEFGARAGGEKSAIFNNPLVRVQTAEAVAKTGYRAFMNGQRIVVTGLQNKLGAAMTRLAPRAIAAKIAGRMNLAKR